MYATMTVLAWVMVNGFPVASFESCADAKAKAAEIQGQTPDLEVLAECDVPHNPNRDATIDYYGPGDERRKGSS